MFWAHKEMTLSEARGWRFFFALCALVVTVAIVWLIVRTDGRLERIEGHVSAAKTQGDTLVGQGEKLVVLANETAPDLAENLVATSNAVRDAVPNILEDADVIATAGATISKDFNAIRQLAGGIAPTDDGGNAISTTLYANSLMTAVDASGGRIGKRKMWGKKLGTTVSAEVWVADQRNESLMLVLGKNAIKHQYLEGVCTTITGKHFYIVFGDESPIRLIDWLKEHHLQTKELFAGDMAKAK